MILLLIFVLLSIIVSFLCSIAEAVLLSVTSGFVELKSTEGYRFAKILKTLKQDINKPLAAILTLNTIAHTVGAAGAGAQAMAIFGDVYFSLFSALLTLLILFFSEIIPKTIGALYWRELAPYIAAPLKWLVYLLYPFVITAESVTRSFSEKAAPLGLSRREFVAMAELTAKDGQLAKHEFSTLKNLLLLKELTIKDAMTPRTVVFSLSQTLTVGHFFHKYDHIRFSRIPIYKDKIDNVVGFILRSDVLLAQARGNTGKPLKDYCRSMPALLPTMSLSHAFNELIKAKAHMLLVVSEYGHIEGILTLEDVLETLLGLEIVDEGDKTEDMQVLAKKLGRKRAKNMKKDNYNN